VPYYKGPVAKAVTFPSTDKLPEESNFILLIPFSEKYKELETTVIVQLPITTLGVVVPVVPSNMIGMI